MFAIIIFYLIKQVIGTPEHHTFCVVGAGTAGIQLTAHLLHDNQDVLLIESDDTVGSSWKKLPINGKLRSVTHAHHQEDADADADADATTAPAPTLAEEEAATLAAGPLLLLNRFADETSPAPTEDERAWLFAAVFWSNSAFAAAATAARSRRTKNVKRCAQV